ncbi:PREDICTED: UPF0496 protein At3g19250-like isoform X2 [Camelina sativa]|uniref:UPF0496 protein At3g19250-like isoform X2 n=1 Tax=Camelina sativa TaxID=90675 RepID=A0ABM0YXN9_CAMSA|nr:PREDICTED: UPF0496 protein At3g19250-like isoform X2 [Camelina sativa]
MPHCPCFKPASPEASLGDDPHPHPSTEGVASSTFNLSRELAHAFRTPSNNDRHSRLLEIDPTPENLELFLSQELKPNKERVQEALRDAKQTTLTQLVSTYFPHSEDATRLCLNLYQNVHSARFHLYTPLLELFRGNPAIDESFCNLAFDVFLKLDTFENPFSSPESLSFQDTKLCINQLKDKLDTRLRKSKSRVRHLHYATAGSALCFVTAVVAVAASAVVIAYHAFPTLVVVAGPLCSPYLPHSFKKKELTNISQLNAAAKGAFVLSIDLDTIDCLVSRLHMGIRNDKLLIRLGLERGRDMYSIQEFVKQLRKSHVNQTHQLEVLVAHMCRWFGNVNKFRSLLLNEILTPRT